MSIWLAFVDDAGHFALDTPKAFHAAMAAKHKGCEVVVTIKRKQKHQGTQSMRYLRGVVIPDIANACGYSDPDDYQSVYSGLMWKFCRLPDGPFGEPRRESTAKDKMTQERMAALIDQLITYAETSIPGCHVRRSDEVELDGVHMTWTPDDSDGQ